MNNFKIQNWIFQNTKFFTGKTSFLNFLLNLDSAIKLGEKSTAQWKELNTRALENDAANTMTSKTNSASVYAVKVDGRKINVIDTPGFGDSRGLEYDERHVKSIMDIIKKQKYIDIIIMVVNGRETRMTASIKYVISQLGCIMPKDILKQIVVAYTQCHDILDLIFDHKQLQDFFGTDLGQVTVDNPFARLAKARELERLNNEQTAGAFDQLIRGSFKSGLACIDSNNFKQYSLFFILILRHAHW